MLLANKLNIILQWLIKYKPASNIIFLKRIASRTTKKRPLIVIINNMMQTQSCEPKLKTKISLT